MSDHADANRIPRMIAALQEAWSLVPHWRLGRLFYDVCWPSVREMDEIPDEQLLELLRARVKPHGDAAPVTAAMTEYQRGRQEERDQLVSIIRLRLMDLRQVRAALVYEGNAQGTAVIDGQILALDNLLERFAHD